MRGRSASDALVWGPNVHDVLTGVDPAALASGRAYAQLLGADNTETPVRRGDEVVRARPWRRRPLRAPVQSDRRSPAATPSCGSRTSAAGSPAPNGRPERAHGIVRVINARREREERLAYLSRFDGLTGEMNRWHMTDVLAATVEDTIRFRSSCGFLIVAIDNLTRINEAYGFDVADEVIAEVAKRLRARMRGGDSSRPVLRQQVRRDPQAVHTPTTSRSRPSACCRACARASCRPRPVRWR